GVVAFERAEECVELRVLAEGLTVNACRFGIGLADDLFGFARGLGANAAQLALHVAENLLAPALALGTEPRRDTLSLGDHAVLDLGTHRVDVVDASDAYVHELDPQAGHQLGGRCEHLPLQLGAAFLGLFEVGVDDGRFLFGELGDIDIPIGGADDFFEVRVGDDVARDGVDDVVEARAGAGLVANRTQKLQCIDDTPAGGRVDDDELATERRDLAHV